MNQKGFSVSLILIGIIIVTAGLIGGAYYLGTIRNRTQPQNPVVSSQSPQPTVSSTPDETKVGTIVLQDGYSFDITLPSGYQYKKERQGDHLGYISDKSGEPFVRFLVSSGGGELSPKGKTTIDGVPFTIDYRKNIGCNADLYPTNAKYPGGNYLYFQIMAKGCKNNKEWLESILDKDMEQLLQSIKFNPRLKELLLGKTSAPVVTP